MPHETTSDSVVLCNCVRISDCERLGLSRIPGIYYEAARNRFRVRLYAFGVIYHRSYHQTFDQAYDAWEIAITARNQHEAPPVPEPVKTPTNANLLSALMTKRN